MSEFTYSDDLPSGWTLLGKRSDVCDGRGPYEYIEAPCGEEDSYSELSGARYKYVIDYLNEGCRNFCELTSLDYNALIQNGGLTTKKVMELILESSCDNKNSTDKVNKTYRPLPDCLTIKESSIDGLGLFATKDIDKDVTLGITHHYIDVGFKDELIRTPLSGFLNHSPNPNATIEEFENGKGRDHTYKNYKLITLRRISLGEEILLDYRVELCGLSGYDGADFLKEDKIEDRVYESSQGVKYYYNAMFGKFESSDPIKSISLPVFYTPADADKFLKRVK